MASIIAVNNDVPAKSFPELIALAKAQPGTLSYASPGVGTPQHIAGELLKSLAGVNITHVPYRGAVFTDVIGGRVSMTLQNMGTILPIVKDGRLRGLAVTSLKRTPVVDLPTVAESGLPGFEATSWFGLMAPAGTPAPIVAKVHQQAIAIAAMPDVREKLSALGLDTTADGPDAMGGDHQGGHRQVGEGDQGREYQGGGLGSVPGRAQRANARCRPGTRCLPESGLGACMRRRRA